MSMLDAVRNLFKRSQSRPRRTGRSNRFRPELIQLEERVVPAGTWTALSNFGGGGTMMLLSDGSVMLQGGGITASWSRLTPTSTGSYANGTFSSLASMHLSRLYFASNVLRDGRVFVYGGEYTNGSATWANSGEIYDPVANTWTTVQSNPYIGSFGDDPSEMLPDGTVLCGYVSGPETYIYNPTNDSWVATGSKLRGDRSDEETWVLLPDGSVLSYDVFASISTGTNHAQRYVPSSGTWVDAGSFPAPLLTSSGVGYEMGPAFLLPDGRVFQVGATSTTGLYTPSTNTWVAGPAIPNGKGADDAPGAVLPNGHVIFAADTPLFHGPTQLFDFDPSANTITQMTLPSALSSALGGPAYVSRMLVLPSGQVLLCPGSGALWVYTPDGSPQTAWKPTISSIADNGNGTYTLTGTQLNGLNEGASYGDDAEMSSNYPIVKLVSGSGQVYFARTFNWSSTGVATGSAAVTTDFSLPAGLPNGSYSLYVIANGIASDAFPFPPGQPVTPTGVAAAPADTQVTLSWNAASGASSYNIYRATVAGQEGTAPYQNVTGTSFVDMGLTDNQYYFYEVSGVNSKGESALSSEVSARPNPPPTVDTQPSADPNPVINGGISTNLSVAGHDNISETLIYTWAVTSGPSGANPKYSDNGTATANNPTVTFDEAGTYTFQVTLSDDDRLTTTSDPVTVEVDQKETSISVSPASATVISTTTQQFSATALDQFKKAMASQPSFTWTVDGGGAGGSINGSGVYTAPNTTDDGADTVRAADAVTSGTAAVTVIGLPAAPTNLVATGFSTSQINLTWTDNATNETSYCVERSSNGTSGWSVIATLTANSTSYANTNLQSGATYYYRVRDFNGTLASLYSNTTSAVATYAAPAAPSNLVATAISSSQINLTWTDAATNETKYNVERSTNGTTWSVIANNLSANTTSYTSTNLTGGTLYSYRVRAFNSTTPSAYSNLASTPTLPTAPSQPGSLSAVGTYNSADPSLGAINLTWQDKANNETSYSVERSTNNNPWSVIAASLPANSTSYSDTGLTLGATYYYRVRCFNGPSASAYSSSTSAKATPTAPAQPGSLSVKAVSSSQINLTWTDKANNETSYSVEHSLTGSTWTVLVTLPANSTSYSNTGLNPSTKYYYRIRAFDGPTLASNYTSSASATTPASAPALSKRRNGRKGVLSVFRALAAEKPN